MNHQHSLSLSCRNTEKKKKKKKKKQRKKKRDFISVEAKWQRNVAGNLFLFLLFFEIYLAAKCKVIGLVDSEPLIILHS